MSVTDETRTAIWDTSLDSARWGRYYGALANRYRRREVIIRFAVLLFVMGATTTLISVMPAILQVIAGFAAAIAIAVDFVVTPAHTAAVLSCIRDECDQTRVALAELWRDLPIIDENEARRRYDGLVRHLEHVTAKDPVPEDRSINEASTMDAFRELEAKYAN